MQQRSTRLGRILFLASLFPGVVQAQKPADQVQIPDQPTCRNCRLVLKRLAVLGDEDGPGALPSRPYDIARGSNGNYYVATPESGNEPPMIFSPQGRFRGTLGRAGEGPGEYRNVVAIEASGDTVFVIDSRLARLTVVLNKQVLWTAPIPRSAFSAARLKDGTLAINARVRDPQRIGLPIHLFDSRGNYRKSVGADTLTIDPRNVTRDMMWLQLGQGGTLLSFPYSHTYTVDRWSSAGEHLGSWHREPPWFQPFDTPWDKTASKPPIPTSRGGFEDAAGRIWTMFLTAAPRWSDGLGNPFSGEGGVMIYPTRDWQRLYQTRIDVIDARHGTLVASGSMPGTFDMVIAPNILGAIRERESGALVVEVWQVQLSIEGES